MVISCSPNASIIAAIPDPALVNAVSNRFRCVTVGSDALVVLSRLSISVRISRGSASIAVMWSQTTVSR